MCMCMCVCVEGGGGGEEARGRVAPEVHLASTLLRLQLVRYGWGMEVGVGNMGRRGGRWGWPGGAPC